MPNLHFDELNRSMAGILAAAGDGRWEAVRNEADRVGAKLSDDVESDEWRQIELNEPAVFDAAVHALSSNVPAAAIALPRLPPKTPWHAATCVAALRRETSSWSRRSTLQ
jgi:hypothetical protein